MKEKKNNTIEPRREKTGFLHMQKKAQIHCTVTAQPISAFIFAIRVIQTLYYLNPKFQASGHPLWLYGPICVDLVGNPEDRFSHNEAQVILDICTTYPSRKPKRLRDGINLKTFARTPAVTALPTAKALAMVTAIFGKLYCMKI